MRISATDAPSVLPKSLTLFFKNCHALTYESFTSWNISQVENISSMFSTCHSLHMPDLSNWDTSSVTNNEM